MPELSDRQRRKAEKAAKISGKHGSGDSSDGSVFEICKIVVMVFIAVIVALGAAAFKQGTLLPQVFEKRAPSAPVPIDCSPDCANGGTCNTVVGKCQCTGTWTGPTCEKVKKKFNFKTKRELAREEAALAQAEAAKAPYPTAMRALLEADKTKDDEALGAALELLKDVVENEPENHIAKANYGSGIARLGQKEEGLEHLQAALELQETCGESCAENLMDTHLFRGRIFNELEKHEEAVASFKVVADSTPDAGDERGPIRKATALMSMNENLQKLGRAEEAAEAVEEAMDVLPEDPTIRAAWKKNQEGGGEQEQAAPAETETTEKEAEDDEESPDTE